MWFAGYGDDSLWRITTAGVATRYPVPGSRLYGVAAGPDGGLWLTENFSGKIARAAPACGLGLVASFASGMLTVGFDLGIDTPAIWSMVVQGALSQSQAIPAVAPPQAFSFSFNTAPGRTHATVESALSDASGQTICSEWVTVQTVK